MKLAGITVGSILMAICFGSTSCRQDSSSTTSAATQTERQLEVTTVRSKKLNTTERLPAELVPYERVDIYAKETGFVKSIEVDRGSKVERGKLIAELEAPE